MRKLLLSLLLFVSTAFAQEPQMTAFTSNGLTVTITAAASAPTPVQATGLGGSVGRSQYLITNIGSNVAFMSYGATSATATTNCVVPTGTAQPVVPVLAFTRFRERPVRLQESSTWRWHGPARP